MSKIKLSDSEINACKGLILLGYDWIARDKGANKPCIAYVKKPVKNGHYGYFEPVTSKYIDIEKYINYGLFKFIKEDSIEAYKISDLLIWE